MKRFIQCFSDKITGVLSGFDRLVLRATLRAIVYPEGMMGLLWNKQVLLKDFAPYAQTTTERLKESSCQAAQRQARPVLYLPSSQTDKEALAKEIAHEDDVRDGLIAVFRCVEPCISYDVHRNREKKRLELVSRHRKCLFLYHYFIDPRFGFMNARIQTWFPFSIQICLNGREWLARQMDGAGIRYRRRDNCFVWIDDVGKAQKLMHKTLTNLLADGPETDCLYAQPRSLGNIQGFPHPILLVRVPERVGHGRDVQKPIGTGRDLPSSRPAWDEHFLQW